MLDALAGLTRLCELDLKAMYLQSPPNLAAYSALTASTGLTRLVVQHFDLPPGGATHVFRHPLPQLKCLDLSCTATGDALSAGELSSMVACCPSLERRLGQEPPRATCRACWRSRA